MIKIAVLGAGHWGPNLLRNFHTHDASEVAWVVDRDPKRLEMVRQRYPDVRTTTDAAEALGDSTDAVVVATPTVTHYALAKAALEAGKHVLVEKPISETAEQAEHLCRLAEDSGRLLMVGHVFLFNAGVRHVREIVASGRQGRVYYLSMVRTNLGPIRMDVNAAWDLAAHDISIANYWLDAPPVAAAAHGASWINRGIEDTVFATLWYPGEVMVHLHVSWLSPRKVRDITVVSEHGMLTFDDMNLSEPVRLYDKRVTDAVTAAPFIDSFASFRTSIREGDIVIPKVAMGEPLRSECEHFLDAIRGKATLVSDGRSGVDVVRALEALQRSLCSQGARVEV